MNGRRDAIVISPYDEAWPQAFEVERDRIEPVLSALLARPLEHVGSTSIPGMPAKAIIDMVAFVRTITDVEEAVGPLRAVGWVEAPEPGDHEQRRRSFCTPSIANRTHHLHVVEQSSDLWRGLLAFRDHLRGHPGLATGYAALKRELAVAHGSDPNQRDAYRRGKSAFLQEVTDLALMNRGIHHLYVETHDWNASVTFWKALGFALEEGWGTGDQPDGILSASSDGSSPYVFLRQVPADRPSLAFEVVLGAPDLDSVAAAGGVAVVRSRHSSGWGPDLLTVRDPDGRIITVREEPA